MAEPSATWINDPHYQQGIDLFNRGQFWHAHEAWETLWLTAHEPVRQFIQGLIQTAAALVHWERGNRFGLGLNWRKARPKLMQFEHSFGGLDIAQLIAWMDAMQTDETMQAPQLHPTHTTKE